MLCAAERLKKMRTESGPQIWRCKIIDDLEWFQELSKIKSLIGVGSREERRGI